MGTKNTTGGGDWVDEFGRAPGNILNEKLTQIGVGYYVENTTPYWVQLFTY